MKRISIFLMLTVVLISCSKDSKNKPDDTIIGKWQYYGSKYYTTDGDTFEREANSCIGQSTITFRANRTITSMNYMPSSTGCVINEAANEDGENAPWQKISEGKYKIGIRVRDSIFFPDHNTMEMMIYQNSYDYTNDVEIDNKSDVYFRVD